MSTPVPAPRPRSDVPAIGYALIVDGQAKADFQTHDQAEQAARELKARFPILQIKIYDAQKKLSENIGLVAA